MSMDKPQKRGPGRPRKTAQQMWSESFLKKIAVDVEGKEWDELTRDDVDDVIAKWKRGQGSRTL